MPGMRLLHSYPPVLPCFRTSGAAGRIGPAMPDSGTAGPWFGKARADPRAPRDVRPPGPGRRVPCRGASSILFPRGPGPGRRGECARAIAARRCAFPVFGSWFAAVRTAWATAAGPPRRFRIARGLQAARGTGIFSLPPSLRSRFSVHPRPSSTPGRGRRARRVSRSPVERAPGAASDVSGRASAVRVDPDAGAGAKRGRGPHLCLLLDRGWVRRGRRSRRPGEGLAAGSAVGRAVGIDPGAFSGTDPGVRAHPSSLPQPPCGSRPLPSPARRCVVVFIVVLHPWVRSSWISRRWGPFRRPRRREPSSWCPSFPSSPAGFAVSRGPARRCRRRGTSPGLLRRGRAWWCSSSPPFSRCRRRTPSRSRRAGRCRCPHRRGDGWSCSSYAPGGVCAASAVRADAGTFAGAGVGGGVHRRLLGLGVNGASRNGTPTR